MPINMKVLVCILGSLVLQSGHGQSQDNRVVNTAPRLVGIEKLSVEDKPSSMQIKIISVVPKSRDEGPIVIEVMVKNLTNHELEFRGLGSTFEVRDKSTGLLLPETTLGCLDHFFSECHTSYHRRTQLRAVVIPPSGSLVLGAFPLSLEYTIVPGTVSVVGYVCQLGQHEGPDCFKSDQINVTVR